MSTIVSNEVTPATLQQLITALTNYEPGLTQYIKELCGIHTNQSLDKWADIILMFKINTWYPTQELMTNINENHTFTIGVNALACFGTNIVYYGEPIKNKTVHNHCTFLKEMYTRQHTEHQCAVLDTPKLNTCKNWVRNGVNSINDNTNLWGNTRAAFFSDIAQSPQYSHNNPSIWNDPTLVTKCDVIFWTMNQADMYDNNCIDNDSNNVLELIYYIPKHLARDTPGQEGYNKVSYFIQGCIATVIAKHIKKMPLYTKFNPILQQQEYNKNFLSEYIKPQ